MKKLFTIALLGLGLMYGNNANAQLFKWGIKGGVNFSSVKNFDQLGATGLKSYTGYHGGLFFGIKLPIVGVQADILYSAQGQKFDDVLNPGELSQLEQTYINVPVVAKVSLIPLINLQAGLQYGILLKSAIDGVDEFDFGGGTESVSDQFKSGDWSVVFGLGFDISKLMLEARYNLGISDLSATSVTQTTDGLKNGVFQLSAGIKF